MAIKIIDDEDFPDLQTAEAIVEELLLKLDTKEILALYVISEQTEFGLWLLLSEAAYKISGHEEESDER